MMDRRTFLMTSVVGATALATGTTMHALAQPGSWELLGQRAVNFRAEQDVIPVTAREGLFHAIQLEVSGNNAIEVISLVVTFGDGASHPVEVRQIIPGGQRTRVIDLPGAARVIRSVSLVYRTAGAVRRGRAAIRLWGLH